MESKDSDKSAVGSMAAEVDTNPPALPPAKTYFYDKVLIIRPCSDARQIEPWKKFFLTGIVSLAAVAAPLQSTILMPALSEIATYFDTSKSLANLSIAFYVLAMGIIPLWWSVISEMFGRRPVYLISFGLFLIWNSVSAVSSSMSMLIVMRVLSGGSSASVQAVGAGTIADLWEVERRGQAMGLFFLGPMAGPLVSPILGGILTEKFGWRSTQWATVIYGGIVWLSIVFFLPETSQRRLKQTTTLNGPNEPQEKAPRYSALRKVIVIFLEPFRIMRFLRFPSVLFVIYYASSTFGCYYAVSISLQTLFSDPPYSFSPIIVGLMYIPCALGSIVASLLGGRWTDRIMRRRAKAAGRVDSSGQTRFLPGDRMGENAWIASLVCPAACVWFGWSIDKHVFWFVPCLATFVFGLASSLIFSMTSTMLTELMPQKTSTGMALNNILRNTLACIAVVVMQPLINAIGPGWIFTGLAVITLANVGIVWLFKRHAVEWAEKMREQTNM